MDAVTLAAANAAAAKKYARMITPQQYGARGDGITVGDAAMSATTNPTRLSTASYTFTSADVGKVVTVAGAGASGATLTATITSVTAGQAVLSSPALTTISGRTATWGTDDASAFEALVAANPAESYVPAGTYMTSRTVYQSPTMSVRFSPRATLKATQALAVLWDCAPTFQRRGYLVGGQFDCADLASTGIYLHYFAHFDLRDVTVLNARSHSVICGDMAAASWSYEGMISNLNVWREPTSTVPANSIGLWLQNATDFEVQGAIILGADIGIRVDGGGNKISHAHPWGWGNGTSAVPTTSFYDNSIDNVWIGCSADSPSTYGWYLGTNCQRGHIVGGVAYNGPAGGNSTATAVWFTNSNKYSVSGLSIEGTSGHLWGWDAQGVLSFCDFRGVHKAFTSIENVPGMGQSRAGNVGDPRLLSGSAEETVDRRFADHTNVGLASGTLLLAYFTGRKNGQTSQFRIPSGATAGAGLTYAAVGLYTEDPTTGNLTLVASIASDTTLFAATFSAYTRSWSAAYQRTAGQSFALGILCVGTTMPTLCGTFPVVQTETFQNPKICAALSGQSSLPASITSASLASSGNLFYGAII